MTQPGQADPLPPRARLAFLPGTLEAFAAYLDHRGFSWKLTSALDAEGRRVYRARIWRAEWPPGWVARKREGDTPVEALWEALKHTWRRGKELRRAQRGQV